MSGGEVQEENILYCSYAATKRALIFQEIYQCITCSKDSFICCCRGCSESCHRGHDVRFVSFGDAYCDCGVNSCSLFCYTVEKYPQSVYSNINFSNEYSSINILPCVPAFRSFFMTAPKDNILQKLESECVTLIQHSKDTFWISCEEQFPRCNLEKFALDVFNFHIQELEYKLQVQGMDFRYDRSISGAEFWVQAKPIDHESASSAIDLHYDKDEEISEVLDVGIFPLISTVTYLTDHPSLDSDEPFPSPTIIFRHMLQDPVSNAITNCYLSYPQRGKHVSFDGRFLHGAPAASILKKERVKPPLASTSHVSGAGPGPVPAPPNGTRITLLVNIWINHKPWNITSLHDDVIHALHSTLPHDLLKAEDYDDNIPTMRCLNLDDIPVAIPGQESMVKFKSYAEQVKQIIIDENGIEVDQSLKTAQTEVVKYQQLNGVEAFVLLPFVSDDSTWSKGEEDAEMLVQMYMPQSVRRHQPSVGGANSKEQREFNYSSSDCFHIHYLSEEYAGHLIINDEDDEDNFEDVDTEDNDDDIEDNDISDKDDDQDNNNNKI